MLLSRLVLAVALVLMLLGPGCTTVQKVQCADDSHCDLASGGVCSPAPSGSQWCSYPDPSCPSGMRWSDVSVGDGLGGQCVGDNAGVDAGAGDAGVDSDGNTPDPARLEVEPTSQSFGNITRGGTSSPATFTVTNTGGEPSGSLNVDVTGSDATAFTVANDDCTQAALNPGDTCSIEVVFEPATSGQKSGSLSVQASPGGRVFVPLDGTSLEPGDLAVTPENEDYGNEDLGNTSSATIFTVTNNGGADTGILELSLSDPVSYELTSDTCTGEVLSGGGTCTVGVAFSPESVGSKVGSLTVSSDPGGNAVVSLGGTGVAELTVVKAGSGEGTITSSPSGIDCGANCSATFSTATVTLTGSADATSTFTGWSGAGCSGTDQCVVIMDAAKTVTASFAGEHLLAVTLEGTGGGRVTSSPAGINCGTDCAEFYTEGTVVTLTAESDGVSTFVGWSGVVCPGLGTCDVTVDGARNVVARFQRQDIAAGESHTCAIVPGTGTVRCWGRNQYGQLGYENTVSVGDTEEPHTVGDVDVGGTAVQVTAGREHTCALLDTGVVKCWGHGEFGRLGYGDESDVGDQFGEMPPGPVSVPGAVVQVAAGFDHTCALVSGGTVYCWGRNNFGQLGYGDTIDRGLSGATIPSMNGAVPVGGTVVQLAAGGAFTCALLDTGNVRCWGVGVNGRLGYGNTDNVGDQAGNTPDIIGDVNVGATVSSIDAGNGHVCVRLTTGQAKCWGAGLSGRLGLASTSDIGDTETPSTQPAIDTGGIVAHITAGGSHTCAVLESGDVRCWGSGMYGQLGSGNTQDVGDTEAPASVPTVDAGGPAAHTTLGTRHTCARMMSGAVRCWGSGDDGRLGYGDMEYVGDNEAPATKGDVPYTDP